MLGKFFKMLKLTPEAHKGDSKSRKFVTINFGNFAIGNTDYNIISFDSLLATLAVIFFSFYW